MTERIVIQTVLPPSAEVLSVEVRPGEGPAVHATHWRYGAIVASVLILGAFLLCVFIVAMPSPHLEPFRDKAWTLLVAIVSGAVGFLFGQSSSAK